MKKTLFEFYEELSSMDFDKRKVQGLVKRANTAGFNIYYAYHEDGPETWKTRWSSDNYKNDNSDITLFTATDLIGKSHGGGNFRKGHTYTAECAIFIFCPLNTLMQDANLRERKTQSAKNKAAEHAAEDYERAIEAKKAVDDWQNLSIENRTEIKRLISEVSEILGTPHSRRVRDEKEKKIAELGGRVYPLADWQIKATSFKTLNDYIEYRKEKAVSDLLKSLELMQEC